MDGDGHPKDMGAHEQLRFSSPGMRLPHLVHIALEIAFEKPFSISSSLDELICNLCSKLVGEFLLDAVARRLLASPYAGAIGDGPEQAPPVPCNSDGSQRRRELAVRHPPCRRRRSVGPLPCPPLPGQGWEAGGRNKQSRNGEREGGRNVITESGWLRERWAWNRIHFSGRLSPLSRRGWLGGGVRARPSVAAAASHRTHRRPTPPPPPAAGFPPQITGGS